MSASATVTRIDSRRRTSLVPRRSVVEAQMEIAEAGRRLNEKLVPLAKANPWLATYLRPCLEDARRVEKYARLTARLGEAGACADHVAMPGHGRAA